MMPFGRSQASRAAAVGVIAIVAAACVSATPGSVPSGAPGASTPDRVGASASAKPQTVPGTPLPGITAADGIHKIQHVVVIMQENRSFDTYFGTFPGANGIPMSNGVPTVCIPDPDTGGCDRPYHTNVDDSFGGPHTADHAVKDIAGGKMDGFVGSVETVRKHCATTDAGNPACAEMGTGVPDVMSYIDSREIPNYWTYAKDFVLQDRMFESVASQSFESHLYMVSSWAALCANAMGRLALAVPAGPVAFWLPLIAATACAFGAGLAVFLLINIG